jgi:hypothetical protein
METAVSEALGRGAFDDAVVELVKARQHVTFVEIVRVLKQGGMDTEGEVAIYLTNYPQMILWAGVNEEFSKLIQGLIAAHRIYQHPASVLIYMTDGGMLNFPIASKTRDLKSKKNHWIPVCFCTFPHKTSPFYKGHVSP